MSATDAPDQPTSSWRTPSLDFDQSGHEIWSKARVADLDRYLAGLRFPYEHRDAMMVILAFAGELARIPDQVTEPMIGQIRLQWWRDQLTDTNRAVGHPIADALVETARSYDLSNALLTGLVDAHEFHFSGADIPDEQALTAHFGKREGILFQLATRILLRDRPALKHRAAEADTLCLIAGDGFGRTRLLAHLPEALAATPSLLPVDGKARLRSDPDAAVSEMIEHVATLRQQARAQCQGLSAPMRPIVSRALLPARLIPHYLSAVGRRADHQTQPARLNPLRRVWTIWRHSFSRTPTD